MRFDRYMKSLFNILYALYILDWLIGTYPQQGEHHSKNATADTVQLFVPYLMFFGTNKEDILIENLLALIKKIFEITRFNNYFVKKK